MKTISMNKLVKKDLSIDRNAIVPNVIYPRSRMLIFGDGDVGKSLYAQDLCMRLLRGESFPGLPPTARKAKGVLYLQSENPQMIMQDRSIKMLAGMGLKKLKGFYFSNSIRLDSDDGIGELVADIKEQGLDIDVLVIDPLIDFHRQDERNNTEMRVILNNLKFAIDKMRISVIVVHHSAKGYDRNPRNRMRGASSIWDWHYTILELRGFEGGAKVNVVKANHGLKKGFTALVRDKYLRYQLKTDTQNSKCTSEMVRKALKKIGGRVKLKKDVVDAAKELAKCGFNTADKAVNQALKDGVIEKVDGRWRIP